MSALPVYYAFAAREALWLTAADGTRRGFSCGPVAEHWLRHNGGGVIVYTCKPDGTPIDQVVCMPVVVAADVRRAA